MGSDTWTAECGDDRMGPPHPQWPMLDQHCNEWHGRFWLFGVAPLLSGNWRNKRARGPFSVGAWEHCPREWRGWVGVGRIRKGPGHWNRISVTMIQEHCLSFLRPLLDAAFCLADSGFPKGSSDSCVDKAISALQGHLEASGHAYRSTDRAKDASLVAGHI